MQGLQPSVILASALLWASASAHAQAVIPADPLRQPDAMFAEHSFVHIELLGSDGVRGQIRRIHEPGAKFVKVHFSEFELPPGLVVEVSNPERTEIYRYSNNKRDRMTLDADRGDDGVRRFSAMSISGDTAVVRIVGRAAAFDARHHRVEIDSWLHRSVDRAAAPAAPKIQWSPDDEKYGVEFSCGAEERYDAACWSDSYPEEYDRSKPVAMLVTADGFECTAWRVGSDNRMFTAEHCLRDQEDLDGAEIWFNYEANSCGGSSTMQAVKVTGKDLLATDNTLDYALFSVDDFASISNFGNLGLDVRSGTVGENIFIPQHGLGHPRQISLESDMNASGLCEIDDNDVDAYGVGTDIGYYCDTTNSSSGSPVIAMDTGRVIALHHLGGCLNMGSKVSLIWPQVKGFFNNKVPKGDGNVNSAPPNQIPEAAWTVDCDALSCTFNGIYSYDGDGDIETFYWDFGDGETSSAIKATHTFSQAGSYPVSLTVEDNEGATDQHSDTVTVSQPNQAPDAKFSFTCIENECSFNGTASSDADGDITSWSWDFGDGTSAQGANASHTFKDERSYSVTLTVEDDDGDSDSSKKSLSVTLPNAAPQAAFSVSCSAGKCQFDASGSSDSDGAIASWAWDLGDGYRASNPQVSHDYREDGQYTISLVVTDDRGASASASEVIDVDVPNRAPEAVFTVSCKQRVCTLDGRSSYDHDGVLLDWNWSLGDGEQATDRRFTHSFERGGEFEITLTVTDDEGATHSKTKTVSVEDERTIKLNATATTLNKKTLAYLKWKGAESQSVKILRNGKVIANASNNGKYFDTSLKHYRKKARYQVCESSGNICSDEIDVQMNN